MRFDLRYITSFDYADDVLESQNELRACPASDERQQLLHYRVSTIPASRSFFYVDYWGTRVDTFGVRGPHRELQVIADATVETSRPVMVSSSPRLDDLAPPQFTDAHIEYLQQSPHTTGGGGVAKMAEDQRALVGDDTLTLVLGLMRAVHSSLEYERYTTYVGVEVEDVLAQGKGVCQDFAHLTIALCRSVGVPARYVSGYLFAEDDSDGTEPQQGQVTVETHAWIEVALPDGVWWGLDPTNRQEVGVRHVKIGHGRDYNDVPPLRGVYSGTADAVVSAEVRIARTSEQQQPQQQQ